LTAAGGLLLLLGLFLPWWSGLACGSADSCGGFKTFSAIDIGLLLASLVLIAGGAASLFLIRGMPGTIFVPLVTTTLALLSVGAVFTLLIEFADDLSSRFGIYVSLLGALGAAAGGTIAQLTPPFVRFPMTAPQSEVDAMAAAMGGGAPPAAAAPAAAPQPAAPPPAGQPTSARAVPSDLIAQADQAQQSGGPPPGWYADPQGQGQRYWDGSQWTEHTAP
jgi:hypothetical protein